jgi:hypothetical protein
LKKLHLIVYAVTILIASTCVSVRAFSGDVLMAANGSAPTLDGSIESAEWADAAKYNITYQWAPYVATAYIKQDGSNLYIAVDQADNTPYAEDGIKLNFDVNHDGMATLQTDDIAFEIYRLSGTMYEYDSAFGNWYSNAPSPGWNAAYTSTGTHFQAEFSISYSRIGVTAGVPKTLGILFEFSDEYPTDGGTNSVWYSWPWGSGSSYNTPSDWAEIIVGDPNFVIPEFWLGPILGLIGCFAAFGTYYVSRRRRAF